MDPIRLDVPSQIPWELSVIRISLFKLISKASKTKYLQQKHIKIIKTTKNGLHKGGMSKKMDVIFLLKTVSNKNINHQPNQTKSDLPNSESPNQPTKKEKKEPTKKQI